MKTDKKYWIERAKLRERIANDISVKAQLDIDRSYRKARESAERKIEGFYQRYMSEYGVSYEQAVKHLTLVEREDWLEVVKSQMKAIDEKALGWEQMQQELDAQSYAARITRLESRIAEINYELDKMFASTHNDLKNAMTAAFKVGYYRSIYDSQMLTGYAFNIRQINSKRIQALLDYPWSGANFSQRLWKNRETLNFQLRETLTQGIIRGDGIDVMARRLREKLDASKAASKRIIATECAYSRNAGDLESYTERGVEEYTYLATLDMRTSETCQDLDMKTFPVDEAKIGLNFPPMHPHCRSTTIEKSDIVGQRLAKGIDGKRYKVRGDMSYVEWFDKYVKT